MPTTPAETVVAPTELDRFRADLVRVANGALDEGDLESASSATALLAQLGLHVSYTTQPVTGLGRTPCSSECPVCNRTTLVLDSADPLPEGVDLPAYKRQVFDLVVGMRARRGWCLGGTHDALDDAGVPVKRDPNTGGLVYDGQAPQPPVAPETEPPAIVSVDPEGGEPLPPVRVRRLTEEGQRYLRERPEHFENGTPAGSCPFCYTDATVTEPEVLDTDVRLTLQPATDVPF